MSVPVVLSTSSVINTPVTTVVPVNLQWNNIYSTSSTTLTGSLNINTSSNAAIVINSQTGKASLTVHYDGTIEYTGKPSEASAAFFKSLSGHIDLKAAGTLALEKTYRRAIKRCLKQAKSMSHEDFIALLEKELDTRNSKAVIIRLTEEETDAE